MSKSAVTLYLCYKNPLAAADWLCAAFGFRLGDPIRDVDGRLIYISLHAGGTCILVGPASGTRFEGLVNDPAGVRAKATKATHVCYQMVEDVDAHRKTAAAAGAKIEIGPVRNDDGQVYYLCRDLEGHLWSFGAQSFDERPSDIGESAIPIANDSGGRIRHATRSARKSQVITLAIVLGFLVAGVWLASSNSELTASAVATESSLGAKPTIASVASVASARGTNMLASGPSTASNVLMPIEGPTLIDRRIQVAKSNSQNQKEPLGIEAELQEAKKQRKTAEQDLIEEREKFKNAIDKQQDIVAELHIGMQQAAKKSKQKLKQLADAKNEIATLKRQRDAEGRKPVEVAKKLQEAGERYVALTGQFENLKKELSSSRRAEAKALAAVTAWKEAADSANQRSTAIETRQLELSRALETLVQKLQEENGRGRDARRLLAAISKLVQDVREQVTQLKGTVSSLQTAVRTSTAKTEKQVASLQPKKATAKRTVRARDHADRGRNLGQTAIWQNRNGQSRTRRLRIKSYWPNIPRRNWW